MKRFLILAIAALMCFSFCGCNKDIQALNEAVGYNFDIPEEWETVRSDGVIELRYDCNKSDLVAEYATITVLTFNLGEERNDWGAKNYWEEYKADVEGLGEYKEIDYKEITLDDSPAVKVKYSYKPAEKTYVSEQVICCRYGEVFLLTLTTPEEYTEDTDGVMAAVLETFKFKQ